MIMENMQHIFPCSELDERERVWRFADYAAGACVSLLESFMRHAQIPEQLKPTYERKPHLPCTTFSTTHRKKKIQTWKPVNVCCSGCIIWPSAFPTSMPNT